MEDTLRCKTTFGGRRNLVEEDLWRKTTFSGRRPLVEDNLQWKTTLGGRRSSVEDDLCWKPTFGGRRPSVEDDFCCMLPTLLCSIFRSKSSSRKWLQIDLANHYFFLSLLDHLVKYFSFWSLLHKYGRVTSRDFGMGGTCPPPIGGVHMGGGTRVRWGGIGT